MALIIGGKEIPCAAKVVDWREHGMSDMPDSKNRPSKGTRLRNVAKTPIDLFVVHWTGGEGSAKGMFNVLNTRELGIEFYLDDDGTIYQFCDPVVVDTFDAGSVNPRSIGIEIKNYGFRSGSQVVPSAGKNRQTYEGVIRGRKVKMAKFYDKQHIALKALIDAICAAIPTIPKVIPAGADGKLLQATMTPAQLKAYKGIIGHFHISTKKTDPGIDVFDYLIKQGIVLQKT